MVKITIKKPVLDTERSTSDDESDSEASDAESTESANGANETLSVSKSGRSKRKCVVNFEKKKNSSKSRKSRSKSMTPDEEEEEEEEEEQFEDDKFTKQMFQCEVCNKVFHSKFVMKTHAKAHRKIEKDLKCDRYYHYYLNSIN